MLARSARLTQCDTTRQPFGARFPQYNHILQLNNDAYSNYNSLQTAFKVRDLHGLSGQLNYVWSRSFDTGSANRGGSFLSDFQNPYPPDKGYAPADFDTPWNVNFTAGLRSSQVPALCPKLVGDGWQINSLFRAQEGRPFTAFVSGDPSNQGLKDTLRGLRWQPASLRQSLHATWQGHLLQYSRILGAGRRSRSEIGRNSLAAAAESHSSTWVCSRISRLTERFSVKFKWEVFNVLNHAMFATVPDSGNITSGYFGTFFATPDVGLGFNPILGTGAQRNMQFGLSVAF